MKLPRGGVILAHPYAPLGGSSFDPVIALIAETCLKSGYIVATFDFRGAGKSTGRTSWTSKPEREDFATVAVFVVRYLTEILRGQEDEDVVGIVLGGYSYGSMIARQTPPVDELMKRVERWEMLERTDMVRQEADALARKYLNVAASASSCLDTKSLAPSFTTAYLLISPLLWPVSSVLSLQMPFFSNNNDITDTTLTTYKTLAIFGGNDVFSSSKRLQSWASKLSSQPDSTFSYKHIPEAGHFWHEAGVGRQLQEAVGEWLGSPRSAP